MSNDYVKHLNELNKRAQEVFLLDEGDLVLEVSGDTHCCRVRMIDKDELEFDLMPNMEERPEAFDYLMFRRNDFND